MLLPFYVSCNGNYRILNWKIWGKLKANKSTCITDGWNNAESLYLDYYAEPFWRHLPLEKPGDTVQGQNMASKEKSTLCTRGWNELWVNGQIEGNEKFCSSGTLLAIFQNNFSRNVVLIPLNLKFVGFTFRLNAPLLHEIGMPPSS